MKLIRIGLHSLVLVIADIAGIAGGALAAFRILGVANRVALQLPIAILLTVGAFWGWFYGVDRKRLLVATLSGAFFGDTWVLYGANGIGSVDPVWRQFIDPSGPVPSSRWNGAVMDTSNHRMIMFGGTGDGVSSISAPLWTTWILSPSTRPP